MLNPTVILVLLIALGASTFGGYRYGKHVCQGEQATAVAAAQVEAIDDANRYVEVATARAVAQAKAEAAARLSAATIKLKGERDAALKARPECARDADSMSLLGVAISEANGVTTK